MNACDFVSFASHLNEGDRPRVNFDQIGSFHMLVPPLNEQRRIVEKIEALFEEIDRGVESLRAAKSAISLYRKSLLKSAFEGHLTAEWRARNPDKLESPEALLARIRNEREVCYQAAIDDWKQAVAEWTKNGKYGRKPAKPTKIGDSLDMTRRDVMEVPRGWAAGLLSDFVQPRGERASPKDYPSLPFIGMAHVEAHTTKIIGSKSAKQMKSSASLFAKNNVLYGRLRPYLNKVAQPKFDGLASGEFIVFEGNTLLHEAFLLRRMSACDFVSFASHLNEGDRPRVNFNQIGSFHMLVPPLSEQRRIVEILDARLEAADKLEAETDAALARADTLRQSILKKAFVGQLVPQDPADEPASALLDRIKAERAAQSKRPLRKPRKRKVAAA